MPAPNPETRRGIGVADLAGAHDPDPVHSEQDARLALRLFEELQSLHGLGARDRELLEAAARLHDIGISASPDGSGHHKHACRMILEAGLAGFSGEETRIVASVVRYHRRALPKSSHGCMAGLPEEARSRVARMASLLRIADGLDRTHRGCVLDLSCRMAGDRLVIRICALFPPHAEVRAARAKADLFRQIFGLEVEFEQMETRGRGPAER